MRITRTPLRITLGGGGSDLAPGGRCITAAVSLYAYVAVNENHTNRIIAKYHDRVENVATVDEITQPNIRACLGGTEPGIELVSMCDVAGGAGLGASAAFTVGTLKALDPDMNYDALGIRACAIDVGWQDQWACALGGVLDQNETERCWLDVDLSGLRLYDTELRHDTQTVLARNRRPSQDVLLEQAEQAVKGLEAGDFGFLHDQWSAKLAAAPTCEHAQIHAMIESLGVPAKLVGAGDGGMILAWSPEPLDTPLHEIPFDIDHQGCVVL